MGVNSTNPDLISATAAYPVRGQFICPPGDMVNFGVPSGFEGLSFVLAGVDIVVPAFRVGPWVVKVGDYITSFGFWGINSNLGYTSFELGGTGAWRGGIVTPPDADYFAELSDDGVGSDPAMEGMWWGYLIPYGWSPVGLPPQQ
jgi:hypothetical protein